MCDNNQNNEQVVAAALPQWINKQLFIDVLKEVEPEFEEIQEFKVNNALAPGENYCTVMLKVEVVIQLKDCSSKPVSFMLKIGHDNGIFREMTKLHNVFAAEAGMYRDVVPELEKMYLDAGIKVRFGAKAYVLPTKQPYILLENLKTQGFRNVNRLEGLDMKHATSVLTKLAQWHAASAARVATKGPYPKIYCQAYLKPEAAEMLRRMFDAATKILLDSVKEYSNSDIYYDKVAKMQNQITDEVLKYSVVDPNEFNVLNHGDCWSNNIMFQYDEQSGELLDTYLVDYQLPHYGTPAIDLLYFILSSCKYEIKLKDFDYMIRHYHTKLSENLNLLKYSKKLPSLKDIHCMLFKYGVWAFVTVTNVMAAVLCDPTDNASLDNFMTDSEEGATFKKQMYSNPRYRRHMEAIFPWLLNRGALDT